MLILLVTSLIPQVVAIQTPLGWPSMTPELWGYQQRDLPGVPERKDLRGHHQQRESSRWSQSTQVFPTCWEMEVAMVRNASCGWTVFKIKKCSWKKRSCFCCKGPGMPCLSVALGMNVTSYQLQEPMAVSFKNIISSRWWFERYAAGTLYVYPDHLTVSNNFPSNQGNWVKSAFYAPARPMITTHGSLGPRWWTSSTMWCLARRHVPCDVAALGPCFFEGGCTKGCVHKRGRNRKTKELVSQKNQQSVLVAILQVHCFLTPALHIPQVSDWDWLIFHGSCLQVYKKEVKKEDNLAVRHQGGNDVGPHQNGPSLLEMWFKLSRNMETAGWFVSSIFYMSILAMRNHQQTLWRNHQSTGHFALVTGGMGILWWIVDEVSAPRDRMPRAFELPTKTCEKNGSKTRVLEGSAIRFSLKRT